MQLTFGPDRGSESTEPLYLYGVMGHAHLAGIDVKVDLEHAGDRQCLLEDKWDFHWQRMYTYAAPPEKLPTLEPGDKISLRCTYDNSMQNRRLGAEYKAQASFRWTSIWESKHSTRCASSFPRSWRGAAEPICRPSPGNQPSPGAG